MDTQKIWDHLLQPADSGIQNIDASLTFALLSAGGFTLSLILFFILMTIINPRFSTFESHKKVDYI